MAGPLARLYATLGLDAREFDKGLTNTQRQVKSFTTGFKQNMLTGLGLGAGAGVGFMAAQAATKAISGVIDVMGDAVGAASDLAESQSKVDQVFTESAASIHSWAAGSAQDFGLSTQAALEAAGTFGNFIQALGNTEQEANNMSRSLVELAADLASFNNMGIEDVLVSLRSGLAGEAEPMRRLGVSISATRVEANILAKGIARTKAEITDAMKVAERYAIIMEDTSKAQGDFDRTSDGLANSQRRLNAELDNLSAKLGGILIGPATGFIEFLSSVAAVIGGGPQGITTRVADLTDRLEKLREEAARGDDVAEDLVKAWEPLGQMDIDQILQLQLGSQSGDILDLANSLRLTKEELNDLLYIARERGSDWDTLAESMQDMLDATTGTNALKMLHPQLFAVRDALKESTPLFGAMSDAVAQSGQRIRTAGEIAADAAGDIRALADQADLAKGSFSSFWKDLQADQQRIKFFIRNPDKLREELDRIQAAIAKGEKQKQKLLKDGLQQEDILALAAIDRRLGKLRGRQGEYAALGRLYGQKAETGMEGTFDPHLVARISISTGAAKAAIQGFLAGIGDVFKASGGPVIAGRSYVVGERGPEMFVPAVSGDIVPNHEMGRGGSTTVNLTVQGLPMRARTPSEVVQQVRRAARMGMLEPARKVGWG